MVRRRPIIPGRAVFMGMVAAARERWQKRVKPRIEEIKLGVTENPVARSRPVLLAGRVVVQLGRDDATILAAGIAYYFLFSLFPLLLGLLAIAGMVFNSPEVQRNFLDFVSENLPGAANFVERNVHEIVRLRGFLGLGATLGLIWTASAVFGAISKGVNRAWGVRKDRPFYIAKPRHLAMALIVLVLFLISASLTAVILPLTQQDLDLPGLGFFPQLMVGEALLRALSWLFSFGIFLLIYRFVPNCQTYWRSVWPGAVIGATLFEVGKFAFVWYLGAFANYDQVYGPLASVIVLLLWAYISAFILLLGAEISSEYEKLYHGQGEAPAGDPG
jgi:membrane protein